MSSASKFSCPSCSMMLKLSAPKPGQRIKCPKCANIFSLPADAAAPAEEVAAKKPAAADAKRRETFQRPPRADEAKPIAPPAAKTETLPEMRLAAADQKAAAPAHRRKAAETFAGNTRAPELPPALSKQPLPSKLECPVCGGMVKVPPDSGAGKPLKCQLCTASFPVPSMYKAAPKSAPAAKPEPAKSFSSPPPPPPSFGMSDLSPARDLASPSTPVDLGSSGSSGFGGGSGSGFGGESAPPRSESSEGSEVTYNAPASDDDGQPTTLTWIVFGISATIFVSLFVLWRLAESGTFK
jgi:DNA-directed RNA polymerase subunit M/transcription elongation factor TFIIS